MKPKRLYISGLLIALSLIAFSVTANAQFNAFKDPSSSSNATSSGPDLKSVDDTVDAGSITLGATAYVVAVFENPGTSAVEVTGVNLYPSSTVAAEVNLNKCREQPLSPGGQCAVTVAVTGLQAGSWRVEILLDHTGTTRLAKAAMIGSVEGSGSDAQDRVRMEIEADPEELDFASVSSSIPLVRSVLLRNRTSDPVNITDIKLDAAEQTGFSFKSQCPDRLVAGQTCVVNVHWTPANKGAAQAVLMVEHTANSRLTKVDLKGEFSPEVSSSVSVYPEQVSNQGLLLSSEETIDFGTDISNESARTITLVNGGVVPLRLTHIRLAGANNGVSLMNDSNGCYVGKELASSGACVLTLLWSPNRVGQLVDNLQVLHTGARGALVLPISGTASQVVSQRNTGGVKSLPVLPTGSNATDAESSVPDVDEVAKALSGFTNLDAYSVTMHGRSKAVLSSTNGSVLVRDGQDVVLEGLLWTPTIVSNGVVLTANDQEILLLFDRAFRPEQIMVPQTTQTTTPTSADDSSEDDRR